MSDSQSGNPPRTIELAKNSGFCFGVQRAIEMAERTLAGGGRVYSLGPVIHNPQETLRLEQSGLRVIDDVADAEDGQLIIRSHGISPETVRAARDKGLELVDATCPLVKRVQNLAQKLHEEGYSVVVIGDADHPEVRAVLGYAPGAIVVSDERQLPRVIGLAKVGVVSQTTQSPHEFHEFAASLARDFAGQELRVFVTICSATVARQSSAISVAGRVDVMFVLGGRNSANTRQLARLCESAGVPTHHLETAEELTFEMLQSGRRVGITAGASTPQWVVEAFIDRVKSLDA
jgi:(E)-4-hydroxy-3-methyl-but-2-enyl pyrophosphate reductase